MALHKSVATKFGGGLNSSYHRIENISFTGKELISFNVCSYFVNPNETTVEPMSRAQYVCAYNLESTVNPFQQGYAHIKALPEWAGSVDC